MLTFYNKLLPSLFFTLSLFVANAQDAPNPVKEIGFGTNNFDNFSMQYRWGNEEKLKRISGNLHFSGNLDPNDENSRYDSQLGFHYSSFKLLSLKEKTGWFYGWKAGINTSFDHSKDNEENKRNDTRVVPRIGGIVGIYYKLSPELFLYGELNPNIYYSYSIHSVKYSDFYSPEKDSKSTSHSFGLSGVSNFNVMLTLAYRFQPAN